MASDRSNIYLLTLFMVATIVVAWTGSSSIQRHRELRSMEDLAMFDQMLWNVREGRDLQVTISGDFAFQHPHHFFSEHFSPVLYLFAWPAGLTSGPEALLVLQALVFAAAAFPLYFWLIRFLGRSSLAMAFSLAWLLSPVLWLALEYDFHMEAAQGLFLFACLLAIWKKSRAFWLWALFYCSVKEDAPAYLAAIGCALAMFRDYRRVGVQLFVLGTVWFFAAITLIIPSYSDVNQYQMGNRLITPATSGGWAEWAKLVFADAGRWKTLVQHLLQFGLLPLLSGVMLLPSMAVMGIPWLSSNPSHALLQYHYPLVVYPVFFVTAAYAVRKLMDSAIGKWRPAVTHACIVVALFSGVTMAWLKNGRMVNWNSTSAITHATPAYDQIRKLREIIPGDASMTVAAQFAPHFARRENLRIAMHPMYKADYIITPLTCRELRTIRSSVCQYWMTEELASADSEYGVAATDGSRFMLLKRGLPNDLNQWVLNRGRNQARALNLYHKTGRAVHDPDAVGGVAWHVASKDRRGFALYGPYLDIPPGEYVARLRVRTDGPGSIGRFRVTEGNGRIVLAETDLPGDIRKYREIELPFVSSGMGGMEVVCEVTGKGRVWFDYVKWFDDKTEDLQSVLMDTHQLLDDQESAGIRVN